MSKLPPPRIVILSVLLAAFTGPHVSGQTLVTIGASKDNTLYENATGSLSNGAGEHFFAGRTNQSPGISIRRGLIAFDIAGNVPPNSTITNVTLTLSMSQTATGVQSISLHRVLADWGEGTSTASGNEGGGAPATTNDATWLHRFFNTSFWAAPGGSFSATASGSHNISVIDFYTWSSTPEMVADVQFWLQNPLSNFGWVLLGNETTSGTAKRFDTKDNSDPQVRPRLNVTYQPSVGVGEESGAPGVFELHQNYPNPFNPKTSFRFEVPSSKLVTLKVYDVLGRDVATLVDEEKEPGTYEATWDATGMASGVYYYRLSAGSSIDTKKMLLVR